MTKEQQNTIVLLRREGLGYGAIADKIEVTKNAVRLFCKRNNLGEGVSFCKECGKPFIIKKRGRPALYCSSKCCDKWWRSHNESKRTEYHKKCCVCGTDFITRSHKNQKYCSRACFLCSIQQRSATV